MPLAIDAMKEAFAAFSGGRARVPQRTHLPIAPHAGTTLVMPGFIDAADSAQQALAVKVVSVFDRNPDRGLARIQAAVLVIDPATGQPIALLEGATLTAIRTAAASGAATDLLARRDSHVLAILGAGVQARTHLAAVCAVRPIEEVRIYSPAADHIAAMIAELSRDEGVSARLVAAPSPRAAARGADIVCTTTTSKTPVFDDTDIGAGTHINAVGSYTPDAREIPGETVARAMVFVDSRSAASEEAGDLIQPLIAGLIEQDHIRAELGEIVLGCALGRTDDHQITLFKSVGLAVQDAAAAARAVANARRLNLGQEVSWL
jgi:ornithine cyclodeaminase